MHSEFSTRSELAFSPSCAFVFQPDVPAGNGFVGRLSFIPLAATRSQKCPPDCVRINTSAVFCQRQTETQLKQVEDCVFQQWEAAERLGPGF